MRLIMLLFAFALIGCATAINDSLDRRGIDPRSILVMRIEEARNDAVQARTTLADAAFQLANVDGLDGAKLAKQLDLAHASGQQSLAVTQELRLSVGSVKASATRFFSRSDKELDLMTSASVDIAAVEQSLLAAKSRHRDFLVVYDSAKLRLSSAVSAYNLEIETLRKSATSRVAMEARFRERMATVQAAQDASDSLIAIVEASDDYLAAIK